MARALCGNTRRRRHALSVLPEVLERPLQLSAAASLAGGVFTVTDEQAPDTVFVQPDATGQNVQVVVNDAPAPLAVFPRDTIITIVIGNQRRNDRLTVDARLTLPAPTGGGNDTLNGGLDGDTLVGESGDDTYKFEATTEDLGTDHITESAGAYGNDTIDLSTLDTGGGATLDISSNASQTVVLGHLVLVLSAGTGIENIKGTPSNDNLTGNGLANSLLGMAGNDTIHAGAGNDYIDGGSGSDQLYGEDGNDTFKSDDTERDTLDGGAGSDTATSDGPSIDTLFNIP